MWVVVPGEERTTLACTAVVSCALLSISTSVNCSCLETVKVAFESSCLWA